ncbi:MAG TPA: hypothetical protein VIZ43_16835 [Trebonia sp.]
MGTRDYVARMPRDVLVKAACEDVGCENWRYGWDTALDERTPFGREWAARIRRGETGRTYRELAGGDGGLAIFRFEPWQRCFAEHRTRRTRFLVADRGVTEHASMRDWVDDFGDHVTRIEDLRQKG